MRNPSMQDIAIGCENDISDRGWMILPTTKYWSFY